MGVKWPYKSLPLYVLKSHESFTYVSPDVFSASSKSLIFNVLQETVRVSFSAPNASQKCGAFFVCGRVPVYAFGPTRSSQFVPARLAHCDSVQADYPIRPFFCTLLRNNPRKRAVLPSSVHESLLRNLLLCTHRQRTNPSAFRWDNYNKSA